MFFNGKCFKICYFLLENLLILFTHLCRDMHFCYKITIEMRNVGVNRAKALVAASNYYHDSKQLITSLHLHVIKIKDFHCYSSCHCYSHTFSFAFKRLNTVPTAISVVPNKDFIPHILMEVWSSVAIGLNFKTN